MPFLRPPDFELPETEKLPEEFQNFINLGKGYLEVDAFGLNFRLVTLESWEKRLLARNQANLDIITRDRLDAIDSLTLSIVKITKGEKSFEFVNHADKNLLRTLLLRLDNKIVRELYDAYLYLEQREQEKFIQEHGRLREKLAKDFFGLPGLSSKPSDSKTQETPNS